MIGTSTYCMILPRAPGPRGNNGVPPGLEDLFGGGFGAQQIMSSIVNSHLISEQLYSVLCITNNVS